MFSKFDENAQKVLLLAKKEMSDLCHPYVGSEHLLLAILHNVELQVTKLLNEYGITYDIYKNEIIKVIGIGKTTNTWFLYTPLLKRIIENAIYDSKDDDNLVTVERLFISLLEEGEGVANRILLGMNIDVDFLYEKFINTFLYSKSRKNKKLLLEEYAVDLNNKYEDDEFDPVIGRDIQIDRIIEILLRRTKNNPLLVGDAGVGKTAIVEELVRRIVLKNVPKKLENVHIYSISLSSLVAGTKYRGEFEERINKIIEEVEDDPDVILFIDEIHTLVGAGGADGAIDASNILKPYLSRGKIRIIGATTKNEYSKYLEKERALDRRFQKVYINEPETDVVKDILIGSKSIYEKFHGVEISDEIIDSIVDLTIKYINQGFLPDKAIDVLDEACSRASLSDNSYEKRIKRDSLRIDEIKKEKNKAIISHDYKLALELRDKQEKLENDYNKLCINYDVTSERKKLTLDHVYDVLYERTKIPIKLINSFDSKKIYNYLTKIVLGQNDSIKKIVDILSNVKKNVPISLFLVGKSGVGKTFFVKEYAKLLYPKDSFIKLDMSEYKEKHSISKIIGSPPGYLGYDDNNFVLARVKQNPYCILLLDEFEKAHPDVIRLFLQVFDDGRMTTSSGEIVDFSNALIFMTSNIGTAQECIGFKYRNGEFIQNKLKEFLGIEFVNRLDSIVFFDNISEKTIEKIINNKLKALGKNDFSPEIVDKIKKECEYSKFGVRKIDRLIDKYIKDLIISS